MLNVNNFYTFKHKILAAQKALAECAVIETDDDVDLFGMKDNEMHDEYEQMDKRVEINEFDEQTPTNDGDKSQETDDEVEVIHVQDDCDGIYTSTESTVNASPQKTQIDAVAVTKRRNPCKRKKVDDPLTAIKVAVQVNECLICPAVLADILELNEHAAAHISMDCKVCKRSFGRYSNLKRHFVTAHSKPKPFVCDICGLGFSFSVNLQTHASLHYSGKIQNKTAK